MKRKKNTFFLYLSVFDTFRITATVIKYKCETCLFYLLVSLTHKYPFWKKSIDRKAEET